MVNQINITLSTMQKGPNQTLIWLISGLFVLLCLRVPVHV